MAKPIYIVQPNRSDGRGYIVCDTHRATSFAVVKQISRRINGKIYLTCTTHSRHSNRNQANGAAEHLNRGVVSNVVYKLGQRMPKRINA
jgi:hypothetical protein